jgi:hypothetical protein
MSVASIGGVISVGRSWLDTFSIAWRRGDDC